MFYKHIEHIFREKQGAELIIKSSGLRPLHMRNAQGQGWIVATITTTEIGPLTQEQGPTLEDVMRNMNNNIGRWLGGGG